MDMDFAVSCPLVRRCRLISGFCPSTRTFDPCFFQTPPRGGSPCIITRPSPPSGWPEDLHLQAADHAQHTTKWPCLRLRPQTLRVCYSPAKWIIGTIPSCTSLSNRRCQCKPSVFKCVQFKSHRDSARWGSFKRRYRKRPGPEHFCRQRASLRRGASDTTLTFLGQYDRL